MGRQSSNSPRGIRLPRRQGHTDPGSLVRAKKLWEEALAKGVEIAHLIPFLTDNYQLIDEM
jgi:hypothetical protein